MTDRLSSTETYILRLLARNEPMYGLQMVRESNGKLKVGTIHVTLNRMQDKGLVLSRTEKPTGGRGKPRRFYRASAKGKRIFKEWEI